MQKVDFVWIVVIGIAAFGVGYLLSDYMDLRGCENAGCARSWGIFHTPPPQQPPVLPK